MTTLYYISSQTQPRILIFPCLLKFSKRANFQVQLPKKNLEEPPGLFFTLLQSCCSVRDTVSMLSQYPDKPTWQQKKDAKELLISTVSFTNLKIGSVIVLIQPNFSKEAWECADHFKEVIRTNPVHAGSHEEFSQWLCHVPNVVNRSLGKPVFSCERVDAEWGKLECEQRACEQQGTTTNFRHVTR
ncbi:FAD-linked sulfhydryl oxidase ERV1-like [Olea europaea subsp. europaea]|uniref:Sulfhydryl oxidase n=1 Tax=Olea europaea subsp. europaea TaxID=158383 RepID=A0A8S0S5U1_OLEEU|nr:FAD-linked sulfhydryl oxidase ERV1-like [Olea europaea subsp. europaea]